MAAGIKVLKCAMSVQKTDDSTLSLKRYCLMSLSLPLDGSFCSFRDTSFVKPSSVALKGAIVRTIFHCVHSTVDLESERSGALYPLSTSVYSVGAMGNTSPHQRQNGFPF